VSVEAAAVDKSFLDRFGFRGIDAQGLDIDVGIRILGYYRCTHCVRDLSAEPASNFSRE